MTSPAETFLNPPVALPSGIEPLPDGLSVIVPVYNSAGMLPILSERLELVLSDLQMPFEVIFVNDGSRDESWPLIRKLSDSHHWVHGLCMMRNYGQHNALLAGLRAAHYGITITMDDDLQHPPDEIPKLIAKLNEGFDVVYGTPEQEQHGLWRDLASQITKLTLQSIMGASNARNVSAFRVFRTRLREAFSSYRAPSVSIDVMLTWATNRFAAMPVRHEPRYAGDSNYTFRKLVSHAMTMMTGFSILPLRVASFTGFAFTLFGLGVFIYVIGRYVLSGSTVAGFPFLASIIAIFSGAQLFALGIIGEYLAKMHFRLMDKPAYAIVEITPPGQP